MDHVPIQQTFFIGSFNPLSPSRTWLALMPPKWTTLTLMTCCQNSHCLKRLICYQVRSLQPSRHRPPTNRNRAGADFWHTSAVPRLNVPAIRLSDGPNGVRGTRFFNSVPSACFPCGTALAATWDSKHMFDVGKLMADEARIKGAHAILGPTVNIQRSPLGGRGFESFSEDPLLSGLHGR